MRKIDLALFAVVLGCSAVSATGASAAMFSPGSAVRAVDNSLIQRVGVGVGARLPALGGDYILVDDDDDGGGGGGGYDSGDSGGGGGGYSDGGGFSHHGGGGGGGMGMGIGLGMGIINMLGNQARRQQRYQENNNNVVRQRRIIIDNQIDIQRRIAKKKAQDEARILRLRLNKEAIAERNKIIKLKQQQQEYANELNKKKKKETAEKEKKRIEEDYEEKKTTEKKAVEKHKPNPTPAPYVRPDPTPVIPTPVVTGEDEDTINNNTVNIIYPPPSCPDNFPELKVGPTVLYPRRTDFPAERTLCTGTTAKGCYLRVVSAPSACGVSQPACVAYCSTPKKTQEVKRNDPPYNPPVVPQPYYPPTPTPQETYKQLTRAEETVVSESKSEPYPKPTPAIDTVVSESKTEPYPKPTPAIDTVVSESKTEPYPKPTPAIETVVSESKTEPYPKPTPAIETVVSESKTEPYPKPTSAIETVVSESKTEPYPNPTPAVETVVSENRDEPGPNLTPALDTVVAENKDEPGPKERMEPAVPTVVSLRPEEQPASPTIVATPNLDTASLDEATPIRKESISQQALKWGPRGSCEYITAFCVKTGWRCSDHIEKEIGPARWATTEGRAYWERCMKEATGCIGLNAPMETGHSCTYEKPGEGELQSLERLQTYR
jgi:hypothetical protein